MKFRKFVSSVVLGLLSIGCVASLPLGASADEVAMKTQSWENNDQAFEEFAKTIQDRNPRNLLARRDVAFWVDGHPQRGYPFLGLADGQAGARGGEGRVFIGGKPTVIAFYLGQPKPVSEVGLYTFNVDMRANQDFEVRFANNATNPGQKPSFSSQPVLSSGDTVIGPNHGGFHTRLVCDDGQPLVEGLVDWVEFRIWPTYPVSAGTPAHSNEPTGASCYIELEVFGEKDDAVYPTAEELAHRELVRNTPNHPEFVERPTWFETVVANREAILRWEMLQDKLAMFDSPVQLGPWYVFGPLPRNHQVTKQLYEARQIDVDEKYTLEDGRTLAWQQRDELTDWQLHEIEGIDSGQVVLLCRAMTCTRSVGRNEFSITATGDSGRLLLLPERRGLAVHRPVTLTNSDSELQLSAGAYQLLMQLDGTASGVNRFWFQPQPWSAGPGAGSEGARQGRRRGLMWNVFRKFEDPDIQAKIRWEVADRIWESTDRRNVQDWYPEHTDDFIRPRYARAIQLRLERMREELAGEEGIVVRAASEYRDSIETFANAAHDANYFAALSNVEIHAKYQQVCALDDAVALLSKTWSMRLSVEDQSKTFADRYPNATEYLARIDALEQKAHDVLKRLLQNDATAVADSIALNSAMETANQEILLSNPLLSFDKLLLVQGGTGFASNWGGPNRLGNRIVTLSPVKPDGTLTTVYEGSVSDMDLHWDAQRLLFSDGRNIHEIGIDGQGLRRITPDDGLMRYDGCYLPNGQIVFVSNACEQAVPCTGGANVGNMHLMNADGSDEHRITFDQDHNWNPTVMHDGRILYTRWEYTDTPHYFTRLLFRMNPDGSGQMEYYGSNSYWPNSMYWPRQIPGHPTMFSCIVSGHHGVSRSGEIVLLDPAKGRHEADGAVQKIPGYGKKVEPIIKDQLVTDVWPKFAAPYPLAESGSNRGAGKYFLACIQRDEMSSWELCLVDVYDNVTPILSGGFMTPIPVVQRPMPPVIPSLRDPKEREATVYIADIYQGPGLAGYPRGSIKKLRIGSHHYRYAGNGDTSASSHEGGWDVKKILGTVPVNDDGSVLFKVPANTPIFVQPLDEEGKAQQLMRSWFAAMPGETLSCIGCHEKQNDVPPSKYTTAANGQRASRIKPWFGPTRGFSFDREVQPVLDSRCVGCHNDKPCRLGDQEIATMDLRAKRLHEGFEGNYSPAYMALQQYVRRAGFESDYHMTPPAEYEADSSMLVRLLKKGHYNVKLTPDEWQRLYTWIDFNLPYPANWRESHRPPRDDQVERRAKYKELFAGIEDRDEDPLPLPPIAKFEPPTPRADKPQPVTLADWPIPEDKALSMQQGAGLPVERELDLGDGVKMRFVLIPAGKFVMGDASGFADEEAETVVTIDRPFYLGTFEVTNEQYARFDPQHDSGYIDGFFKDRTTRGTPINRPELPVVRISWNQAISFSHWLSTRSGVNCTLPTEAQWEWACRAGTATTFSAGDYAAGMKAFANVADRQGARQNYGRAEPGYDDGVALLSAGGRYAANRWGLHDMHGNVAEWCRTTYRPYPYDSGDGRDAAEPNGLKVVRGGSWAAKLKYATSAARWRYQPHQPMHNVGFRVVIEIDPNNAVAAKK